MIKRRRILLGGLGIAAAAGLGVLGFGRVATESEIASAVRRRLSFLRLDEAGLRSFAKDQVSVLLAKRPTWNRMKYHFLSVFTKSFTRYDHSNDKRSRIERLEDGFAATYLLSSDFFLNGADESRTVEYVAFYDPLRACGNPFARSPVEPRPTS